MAVAQFLFSFVLAAGVTVGSLWLGTYTYSYDADVDPYRDSGFLASPDWSSHTIVNKIYAGSYAGLLLLFCLVSSQRVTMLRRLLFVWSISQIVQLAQTLSTRFPDPNVALRNRDWDYTMFTVQYAISGLMVQFYSNRTWLRVLSWMVCSVGVALLIPTHQFYTVDMICGLFGGVGPFLLYHWYVRTTTSISKRKFLSWFEADALAAEVDAVRRHHAPSAVGGDSLVSVQKGSASTLHSVPNYGSHALDAPTAAAAESDHGVTYLRLDDPAADFTLEHFRHRTLTTNEREDYERQVLDVARSFSDNWRRYFPFLSSAIFSGLGASMGFINLIAMNAADEQRPLHIPLPWDCLFGLPRAPDHTADVLLYTQVISVLLFVLCSRWRCTMIRRTAAAYGIIITWRSFTVPATFPPDPSPICVNREHPPGTTCGDLIFSGHTVAFMLSALVIRKYTRPLWLEAGVWAFSACGLCAVIVSRLHYTRDVVTAVLVVTTIFHLLDKSVYNRPDRAATNKFLRLFESDYYFVKAEDELAAEEGRRSWHDWVGRFWDYVRGEERVQQQQQQKEEDSGQVEPIMNQED